MPAPSQPPPWSGSTSGSTTGSTANPTGGWSTGPRPDPVRAPAGGPGGGPAGRGPRRPNVLVVDDDRTIRESLRRSLEFNGFGVRTAVDGADALESIAQAHPDAIVLDVMMPRVDGLQTCRLLRARGDDVPVLALTARDAIADRVAGLDAGADDYLVKPFALEELLARLRALLRRVPAGGGRADGGGPAGGGQPGGRGDRTGHGVLSYAGLTLDPLTRDVGRLHGGVQRYLRLTRTEFSLLEMFLRNPQIVLTRERILEEVWGFDFPTTANSLEVYVGYLRRKTEGEGEPRLIHTVRGIGYVLRESPP